MLWTPDGVVLGVVLEPDVESCPPVFGSWAGSNLGSMAIGVRQPGDPDTEAIW